jgi:hypothetical protein
VTHLYESLTGNNWDVHGESKYCCYSVYDQKDGTDNWTPRLVNQVLGEGSIDDKKEDGQKAFTWA